VKVIYRLDPSFAREIIETTNWRNNFEYKVFGYASFELEYNLCKGQSDSYSGTYCLDISRSNETGISNHLFLGSC
jgi:hypothetical protein